MKITFENEPTILSIAQIEPGQTFKPIDDTIVFLRLVSAEGESVDLSTGLVYTDRALETEMLVLVNGEFIVHGLGKEDDDEEY